MIVSQSQFAGALLDPDAEAPMGLVDPQNRPAGKRFDVYRNNVAVSLSEALETGFPVVRKLLGEQNFRSLAAVFFRERPPSTPLLMHYGEELPGFLDSFPPLAHLPYLSDVARLELAIRRSYHAADASPVDPSDLSSLDSDVLVSARFGLAPAVRVISSRWPILGIWRRNKIDGSPKPEMRPEDVIVARRDFDPEPRILPPGGAEFVRQLMGGLSVGEALEAVSGFDGFDLTATFSELLAGAAITVIELEP